MPDEITICRVRRRALGIKLAEFCKRVDIWTSNLCQIERAEIKVGPSRRRRLAEALGLSEEELFESSGYARLQGSPS